MEFLRNRFGVGKRRQGRTSDIPQVSTYPTTPTVSHSTSNIFEKPNPYSKYGLNSPPQGEYAQDLREAEKLIKRDGFRGYLDKFKSGNEDTRDKTKCLVFLYGRGFYVNDEKDRRKRKVKAILEKPSAIERCKRLLESEGADRDLTASNRELYLQLCRTLHRYFQQEGSFGFLPNDNNDGAEYYFRMQRQGNCFMHSPCVMMPYLFQSRGIKECHPVDLSKFVRRTFNDSDLFNYIVKDSGGDGSAFLKMMLKSLFEEQPKIESYPYDAVIERGFDLRGKLKKYGPGIVTGFDCHKRFRNEEGDQNAGKIGLIQFQGKHHSRGAFVELPAKDDDEQYKEKVDMTLEAYLSSDISKSSDLNVPQKLFPSTHVNEETTDVSSNTNGVEATAMGDGIGKDGKATEEESHSMLLIGGRLAKGRLWLLFQNWWDDMQLVEVDGAYFNGSGATLSFVRHKKEEFAAADLDSFYTMNRSLVADSNNLDRADCSDSTDGCFKELRFDRLSPTDVLQLAT